MTHSNTFMRFLFFSLIALATHSTESFSSIRGMETTRLQSTSGAGVASPLVNEAAFLNPASIVFIPSAVFYYQQGKSGIQNQDTNKPSNLSDGSNEAYLVSDSSGQLKGTFSYQKQAENQFKRERFTSSFASSYGKRTAIGVIYRYTTDEDSILDKKKKFHQGVLGITHILSESLSIGGVLIDPFISNKEDARIIGGLQYSLFSSIIFIFDYGVNFNDNPNENDLIRGAFQMNFFKDIFLRVGKYNDRANGLSGDSWGLSWIGPRLALEYAFKSSEVISEKTDYLRKEERIIESSLSLALIF